MPDRILFDTTVLCSAIRNPGQSNYRLLVLAQAGIVEAVFTDEIIAEWLRNCYRGLGGLRFNAADIEAFCDSLAPMLEPSRIRRIAPRIQAYLYPIKEVLNMRLVQVPMGLAHSGTQMLDANTLGLGDVGDFHVVNAALGYGCRYLCSSNGRDLPDGLQIGSDLEIVTPGRLLTLLTH